MPGERITGLVTERTSAKRPHTLTRAVRTLLVGLAGLAAAFLLLTRWLTGQLLTLKPERRRPLLASPTDYGLASEDVQVATEDGLWLYGWYLPGHNGATIMVQHGTPGGRQDVLPEAAILNRRGYNVLVGSFRAHDECDGLEVSFGCHELKDLAAWHGYLLDRAEVDPARIGYFGESMGGAVGIRFAAETKNIAAIAAASVPAVMDEAVAHVIGYNVSRPRWSVPLLTRLLVFWGERRSGCRTADIAALRHASQISPRPLFIIHGGDEHRVPPEHGRLLYEAAREPKLFWFVPEAGHGDFELFRPAEYEHRLLAFFDQYLL